MIWGGVYLTSEKKTCRMFWFSYPMCEILHWVNAIKENLINSMHVCSIFQPKVVTDTDETELARQLERLERENAEVDGDDDAEEMEAKTED